VYFVIFTESPSPVCAESNLKSQCLAAMKKATTFMVEEVSTNGGYLWHYMPDMSRRWGEMEAYETMIWVQPPGTTSMGHLFLDVYRATGDEYYYEAARKAANALIWGQLDCGGWNYIIDFAGDRSLKIWYDTIGKNGWRLEEFQHYYGNATFDDDVSSDAARFLLRMYCAKLDPAYKYPLDKAIDFIIESQYPLGGWPQRYPLRHDFTHHGKPDYTSFYTFNDDVVWENVHFLIQCYMTLGGERFLDPVRRGMNFYLITQQGAPQAGWGQQYDTDLRPVGARTYEPDALLPGYTATHIRLLIRFYRLTGESKFLARIPEALDWLESCALTPEMTEGGKYTHPVFVEIGTNRPIFVHRKGSNVIHGYYYSDYDDRNLLTHYGGKTSIDTGRLSSEYKTVKAMTAPEATRDSPLLHGKFTDTGTPQTFYDLTSDVYTSSGLAKNRSVPDKQTVRQVLAELEGRAFWPEKHVYISNPYIGDGTKTEPTDRYATTHVGDETDTSPFEDDSDREYISTSTYIRNMRILINYLSGEESSSSQ